MTRPDFELVLLLFFGWAGVIVALIVLLGQR